MKVLKNQKGSVLLMVMVIAVVFAVIVMDLSKRFVTVVKEHHQFSVSNENIRVADEMAKIVSKAYEYGTQTGSAGCLAPNVYSTHGSGADQVAFCFAPAGNVANCTKTSLNSDGKLCLDPSPTTVVIANNDQHIYQLNATLRPTLSAKNLLLQKLVPTAAATISQTAMPPEPTDAGSTFTPLSCTGTAGDPALCRSCGPGQTNFCVQIVFCPADKPTCTAAADKIKIDMMIERQPVQPTCAAQTASWTSSGVTCTGLLPTTPAGTVVLTDDITAPTTGSANYQCGPTGVWNMTPTSASCVSGATALCWTSANPSDNGNCAPVGSCTTAGATLPNTQCYTNNNDGSVTGYTATLTCTSVASASDPSCQNATTTTYCFTAETPVTMADGSKKAISQIKKGEKVLSFNGDKNLFEPRTVVAEIHHPTRVDRIFTLVLDNGQSIEANGEHRFFLVDRGVYAPILELIKEFSAGHEVAFLDEKGERRTLKDFSARIENVALFNLTVDTNHNYFAGGILVHNLKQQCQVDTASQCDGVMPPCGPNGQLFRCNQVSQSVVDAFNTCMTYKAVDQCANPGATPTPAPANCKWQDYTGPGFGLATKRLDFIASVLEKMVPNATACTALSSCTEMPTIGDDCDTPNQIRSCHDSLCPTSWVKRQCICS